jgi:hypothetical protein
MESVKPIDPSSVNHSLAEPIQRVTLADDPKVPITGKSFSGFYLYEVTAHVHEFRNCDFSNAVIERSYFRSAKFVACNFTGAKILDSNFRSAEFSGCKFDYLLIQRSHISVPQVLLNLPPFANVRRDLLQQLRANALSIADGSHINALVQKELDAERQYWREARARVSVYYEQKHGTRPKIVTAYWHSFRLWMDQVVWGHGESTTRLLFSTFCALLFLSVIRWLLDSPGATAEMTLGGLTDALENTWKLYLDFPSAEGRGLVWSSLVLMLRYLSLGLFISVLFRKLSKR